MKFICQVRIEEMIEKKTFAVKSRTLSLDGCGNMTPTCMVLKKMQGREEEEAGEVKLRISWLWL